MTASSFDDGFLAIGATALIMLEPSRDILDALVMLSLAGSAGLLWFAIGTRLPSLQHVASGLLIFTLLRLAVMIALTHAILIDAHGGRIVDTFGALASSSGGWGALLIFAVVGAVQAAVITAALQRAVDVASRLSPAWALRYIGLLRFIRSDAIAAAVIVLVGLASGIVIGTVQHHLTAAQALHTYAALVLGAAMIAQVPSMLCAVAAGLIVTRLADGGSTPGAVSA
jgi:type III secretion protein V